MTIVSLFQVLFVKMSRLRTFSPNCHAGKFAGSSTELGVVMCQQPDGAQYIMSESNNDVICLLYYNGRRYFEPNGQVFEGDTKIFCMSPGCKYTELKKIIYKKLRLQRGSAYKLDVNEHRIDGRLDGSHKIDGTHLYGKHRGTLLISTAVDGNNYVLPVAFAVVNCENIDNGSWFLAMLRIHVTQKEGIYLVTDRHAGILTAVNNEHLGWQPPKAYHVFCLRHVASNFNHKFKNILLKKQLNKLGYTTSRLDFDAGLENFKESSPQIAAWIDRIPKKKWSISYDVEERRFGHMTTNLSECVNKVLKGARNLPITSLVRFTYARLNKYILAHGQEAQEEMDKGNRYAKVFWVSYLNNQQDAARHFVTSYDRQKTRFEVQDSYNQRTHRGGKKWWVSLADRVCQCGEFTSFRYPCSHVIAACKSVNHDPLQYIDPTYGASY
ncbi:uncharacterized protein LOC133294501 [Gastrolobium bilobum]|uniref:uncharacterized protein LOC133294501 n=1 Tax=Gastrolobium bilobum TaxID=150636 RepID=UPI002AB1D85B|nr:uncharacterized protein LOC133294501 [Gastrolobium bilobum]